VELHRARVAVLLLAFAAAISTADAADGCPEACWEKCFQVSFCGQNCLFFNGVIFLEHTNY
jgi:uncharacterized membrane protein